MTHRTVRNMLALFDTGCHRAAVTVPAGTSIEVLGAAPDHRFVTVSIDGKHFDVFRIDLQERCRPIEELRGNAAD